MIEIVSATRLTKDDFWRSSALGISLRRLEYDERLSVSIAFKNQTGLSELYNSRILADDSDNTLVFIHDDVWIDDFFFADRVLAGLQHYDVIGVAGNRRRLQNQPAWPFVNTLFTWDDKSNLSGTVAHGQTAFGNPTCYGVAPVECELLDGVFLAVNKEALISKGVQFDSRFDFHFYDMDFCRSARQAGLKLGTWPICLTHQSGGAFGTKQWQEKYRLYLQKWEN